MPNLKIEIGGYTFQIACEDGEEGSLKAAAQLLDSEASKLTTGSTKIPENKMLLMLSLIMADELLNASKVLSPSQKKDVRISPAADKNIIDSELIVPKIALDKFEELISQAEAIADSVKSIRS
jgi:cell division protein ZapA